MAQTAELLHALAEDAIADELGYTPQVSFDEGLAATVQWYEHNRDWWEPLKKAAAER